MPASHLISASSYLVRLSFAVALIVTAGVAQSALAQGDDNVAVACNRACLDGYVGRYVAAMVKHDPSDLPLAQNFVATENGLPLEVGEGSWKTLETVKSQPQFVADVQAQEGAYIGVVQDSGRAAFFGLRLKINQGQITQAESILSHDGESGPAFEPEGFIYRESPYIRDIPAAHRNTREDLLKVANLYWDVSTSTHRGDKLPYSPDCWHFENGMNTDWERNLQPAELAKKDSPENLPQDYDGRIWTCAREAILTTSSWKSAHDRHFLVDPERGLVFNIVYVDVGGRGNLGGPPSTGSKGTAPGAGPGAGGPGGNLGGSTSDPIEGPGGMPLGMSRAGMQAAMSGQPYSMAHFEVMRIVGGKIAREQDVMRLLTADAKRPFSN